MQRTLPPHVMRRPLGYTLGDVALPTPLTPDLQPVSLDAATAPVSVAPIASGGMTLPTWLTPGVLIGAGALLILWLLSQREA